MDLLASEEFRVLRNRNQIGELRLGRERNGDSKCRVEHGGNREMADAKWSGGVKGSFKMEKI